MYKIDLFIVKTTDFWATMEKGAKCCYPKYKLAL